MTPRGKRDFFKSVSVSGILVNVDRKISGEQFKSFHKAVCNFGFGAGNDLGGKILRFCIKSTGSIPYRSKNGLSSFAVKAGQLAVQIVLTDDPE